MRTILFNFTRKISLFWRLPLKYKLILSLNFFLCALARSAIKLIPLTKLACYFGKFQQTTTISTIISTPQKHQALIIGKLVRLAAKYTPWDSSCLTQAMVAKFWCQLYKTPYVFYIGLAKSATEANQVKYDAHAWLTAGPITITGGESLFVYHVISSYLYMFSPRRTCAN